MPMLASTSETAHPAFTMAERGRLEAFAGGLGISVGLLSGPVIQLKQIVEDRASIMSDIQEWIEETAIPDLKALKGLLISVGTVVSVLGITNSTALGAAVAASSFGAALGLTAAAAPLVTLGIIAICVAFLVYVSLPAVVKLVKELWENFKQQVNDLGS